jgi:hypothetical protein
MADLPAVVVSPELILPVPNQRTQLGRASFGTKIKKFLIALLAGALVGGISAAAGAILWPWVGYVGYVLTALLLLVLVKGAFTGMVAPCPYCGAILGAETGEDDLAIDDEAQSLWCKKCGEYVTLQKGELRPHEPTVVTPEPTFKSHVFTNGVWPPGCVLCGRAPVRRDDLGTTDVSGAALLVGRLSVSTGSVKGVPYCAEHGEAVKLSIDDEKLQLTWRSLPMLRQYLAANRKAGNAPVEKS